MEPAVRWQRLRLKLPPPAKTATASTVGIIAGDIDSTGIRIASDLSRILDTGNDLRVIPIIGKGSVQNINDLLTLKAVDIAIVQSDVMARYLKSTGSPASNRECNM